MFVNGAQSVHWYHLSLLQTLDLSVTAILMTAKVKVYVLIQVQLVLRHCDLHAYPHSKAFQKHKAILATIQLVRDRPRADMPNMLSL